MKFFFYPYLNVSNNQLKKFKQLLLRAEKMEDTMKENIFLRNARTKKTKWALGIEAKKKGDSLVGYFAHSH